MIADQPRFTVVTEGHNELDLRGLCERIVNQLWIPDHLTPEQAAEYAADYFRRTVLGELEMPNIGHRCRRHSRSRRRLSSADYVV